VRAETPRTAICRDFYGSDGTRTRNLRRDSSAPCLAARTRRSPLVARCAAFPVLALPAFATGCRRCVPRTFQNGCAPGRGLRRVSYGSDGTRVRDLRRDGPVRGSVAVNDQRRRPGRRAVCGREREREANNCASKGNRFHRWLLSCFVVARSDSRVESSTVSAARLYVSSGRGCGRPQPFLTTRSTAVDWVIDVLPGDLVAIARSGSQRRRRADASFHGDAALDRAFAASANTNTNGPLRRSKRTSENPARRRNATCSCSV
jgi:hypothetical protein